MPFGGFKDFESCISSMVGKGHDAESAKKICGTLQAKEEKVELQEDGSEIIKNKYFEFFNPISIQEFEQTDKPKWVKINGMAVEATTSLNGRTYIESEISKQHNKEGKVFINHDTHPMNAVGRFRLAWENNRLMHYGEVRNTQTYPDVVEMIKDKLIDAVSIGASGDIVKVKKGNEEQFQVRNMDIHEISLVGLGGVKGAGIDMVIGESFKNHNCNAEVSEKAVMQEKKPSKKFIILKNR